MARDLAGLRAVRGVLFDMDGVIHVRNRRLPGVREAIDYLASSDRAFLFLTNNPTMTAEQFVDRLARMEIHVHPEQVLGSAEATASWLSEQVRVHGWPRGPVIVIGQDGRKASLQENRFEITTNPDAAIYAVVGIDFDLTYQDLENVTVAIRGGAKFIGTNPETTYPSERGPLPGTGSILAFLAAASRQQPVVIGKPNRGIYEQATARLNLTASQTLMVGDQYETDISGAIPLGFWTAGILSGICTRSEFESANPSPDLIVENLPELVERLHWADEQ